MIGYTKEGKPIENELTALSEAAALIDEESLSLREASSYLADIYNINISHVGLRKRILNGIYKQA